MKIIVKEYIYIYMPIAYICIHMPMYVYIYTYIHAHIYIHIYTYMQVNAHICLPIELLVYYTPGSQAQAVRPEMEDIPHNSLGSPRELSWLLQHGVSLKDP